MRKSRQRGEGTRQTPFSTTPSTPRNTWVEMSQEERRAWIKEKHAWLTEKRQREQEYLNKRDSDLKTDRAYREDAGHELDMLAMLSELSEEAEHEGNTHK